MNEYMDVDKQTDFQLREETWLNRIYSTANCILIFNQAIKEMLTHNKVGADSSQRRQTFTAGYFSSILNT